MSDNLGDVLPLNASTVLTALCKRYASHKVYSCAGSTLLAVNPFSDINGLYGEDVMDDYRNGAGRTAEEQKTVEPHVYDVAQRTLINLQRKVNQQSVIISGESGAGKTVTAKHLMSYLVSSSNDHSSSSEDCGLVEQKVLQSNPLLEAFGNASTIRNHNSSRFGKYIQLHFNGNQTKGACIHTYLLEKTRVVQQSSGERNFHIFYQLLSAVDSELSDILHLPMSSHCSCNEFVITPESLQHCESDYLKWQDTLSALNGLYLDNVTPTDILQVLSAILHLGNVQFVSDEEDETIVYINSQGTYDNIESCALLLGIDPCDLETTFTHKLITVTHTKRKSLFRKSCVPSECRQRRDAFSKLLYASLFDFLVQKINAGVDSKDKGSAVGLLDIYGFESFSTNSLEQLCINYANEKLQQHYVSYFLRDLQSDYQSEAISFDSITFTDNKPCVDLLEDQTGLFALINEECSLNRHRTTLDLCDRVTTLLSQRQSKQSSVKSVETFTINHYAEPVLYSVDGLLVKNKDDIPVEVLQLLQRSSSRLISTLFSDYQSEPPGKKKKTVLAKFKTSVDSLMRIISTSEAHYIRCLKPNRECKPSVIDHEYMLRQLKSAGIVETIELAKQGYPDSLPYEQVLNRYSMLLRNSHHVKADLIKSNAMYNNDVKSSEVLDFTFTQTPPRHLMTTPQKRSCAPDVIEEADCDKENFSPNIPIRVSDEFDDLHEKQLQMTPRRHSAITPKRQLRRRLRRRSCTTSVDHTRKVCASIMQLVFYTESKLLCKQFGRSKLFLKDKQLDVLENLRSKVESAHAFTIQCAWIRYVRNKHRRREHATVVLQCALRGWSCEHEFVLKMAAVRRLQYHVRVWLQRRKEPTQYNVSPKTHPVSTVLNQSTSEIELLPPQLPSSDSLEFVPLSPVSHDDSGVMSSPESLTSSPSMDRDRRQSGRVSVYFTPPQYMSHNVSVQTPDNFGVDNLECGTSGSINNTDSFNMQFETPKSVCRSTKSRRRVRLSVDQYLRDPDMAQMFTASCSSPVSRDRSQGHSSVTAQSPAAINRCNLTAQWLGEKLSSVSRSESKDVPIFNGSVKKRVNFEPISEDICNEVEDCGFNGAFELDISIDEDDCDILKDAVSAQEICQRFKSFCMQGQRFQLSGTFSGMFLAKGGDNKSMNNHK